MKKIFAYISVAAVLAAAVSCGNGKGKQEVSPTEKAEEAPLVSVVTVNKQSVPQQTTYTSSVEAYAKNNIAPQQALRISDMTAFFLLGEMVEYGETTKMFYSPQDKRTEDYITGRFG